jgi:hypothetical protein
VAWSDLDGNEYELTISSSSNTDHERDNIIYRRILQAASFQAD